LQQQRKREPVKPPTAGHTGTAKKHLTRSRRSQGFRGGSTERYTRPISNREGGGGKPKQPGAENPERRPVRPVRRGTSTGMSTDIVREAAQGGEKVVQVNVCKGEDGLL